MKQLLLHGSLAAKELLAWMKGTKKGLKMPDPGQSIIYRVALKIVADQEGNIHLSIK